MIFVLDGAYVLFALGTAWWCARQHQLFLTVLCLVFAALGLVETVRDWRSR